MLRKPSARRRLEGELGAVTGNHFVVEAPSTLEQGRIADCVEEITGQAALEGAEPIDDDAEP